MTRKPGHISKTTLAEAVVFAMEDAALEEAHKQFALNQRSGNMKRARDWDLVVCELNGGQAVQFSTAA